MTTFQRVARVAPEKTDFSARPAFAPFLAEGLERPMKKSAYSQKLLDPRWQKKRLDVLSRDGFAFVDCWDTENTLHVHHSYYVAGREPWEYPLPSLVTLCKECHDGEPKDALISDIEVLLEYLALRGPEATSVITSVNELAFAFGNAKHDGPPLKRLSEPDWFQLIGVIEGFFKSIDEAPDNA